MHPDGPAVDGAGRERRAVRALLALWCLFILYGSFFPFRFSVAPAVVQENVSRAQVYPFVNGKRKFSVLDTASNVLLFVPFGFLVAGSGGAPGGRRRWASAVVAGGVLGCGFGILIEVGQLFAPGRTGSLVDVAANTAGALAGAAAAAFLLSGAEGRLAAGIRRRVREEPALLPLGLLAAALIVDSAYPFALTLDVSTAWGNLRKAQWIPLADPGRRFWGDLIMDRVVPWALLAALARRVAQRPLPGAAPALLTWGAASLFAAALEAGKLFVHGRAPHVDNVLLAAAGALLGVSLVPALARSRGVRARPAWALLALATLLLVYSELTPFRFAVSPGALHARVARIEWLPLASYYRTDPPSALFDLWNKLLLSGFFGYAVAAARGPRGLGSATAGLLIGAALEAAQVAAVARVASVTDVLIFGLGAGIGGAALARYQSLQRDPRQ